MTERTETYYECNSCGVTSNDPVYASRVEKSTGNAFVSINATNMWTGEDLLGEDETHLCVTCWGLVQTVVDRVQRKAVGDRLGHIPLPEYRRISLGPGDPFAGGRP